MDRTIVFPATFVTADNHQPFIQAVPSAPAGYNDYEWEWVLENIIIETMYLDQLMSLPQFGGNSLLVRAGSSPSPPLVMFPRIDAAGLEIWFHSAWCGGMMQLMEVDVLDLCPQRQIWPRCLWCGKFHLPMQGSGSHRSCNKHTQFGQFIV